MFRELNDAVQIEASQILAQFPRLVGERKLRTSADPFVIALARVEGFQLVTDEKPTAPCRGRTSLMYAMCWARLRSASSISFVK